MFVRWLLRHFAKVQFFFVYLTDENGYYTLKLDEGERHEGSYIFARKPQKLKFNTQQKLMVGLKLHS